MSPLSTWYGILANLKYVSSFMTNGETLGPTFPPYIPCKITVPFGVCDHFFLQHKTVNVQLYEQNQLNTNRTFAFDN